MARNRRDVLLGGLALQLWGTRGLAQIGAAHEQWLGLWLEAFNAPRFSAYARFVEKNVPALLPYLDEDLALREVTGGFDLIRSEVNAAGEIIAWVKDRHWDRFSKVALSVAGGRLADITFSSAPPPASFRRTPLPDRECMGRLRRKLRREEHASGFCGSVLVGRAGAILYREAFGRSDPSQRSRNSPETRFCIGSAGKMFTAVAVLRLIQQGRLGLNDTVGRHLPGFPGRTIAEKVTIRHLLSHTGGTGDFFGPEYEREKDTLRTPGDFVRTFGGREPLFSPGERWAYSNLGYMVLGAVLEQGTGQSWEACIKDHVLEPARMLATSSTATPTGTATPLTSTTQTGLKGLDFYQGWPAGGGYSTVDDLHRFAVALAGRRLLDERHTELLTTPVMKAGESSWSLGLRVRQDHGVLRFGHGGSAPGVNAEVVIYPTTGHIVIVLCNRGHPSASNVSDFLASHLPLG